MTAGRPVRHIVMWRLSGKEAWERLCNEGSVDRLFNAMRQTIAGLLHIEIGRNACASPDAADLVLYCEFEDWQALQRYESHPLHAEFKGMLSPLRNERRVVDYQAPIA